MIPDWPLVEKGGIGDAVRGVQEVIQFHDQRENPPNHVDGIVGPITWRALVTGMLSGSAWIADCGAWWRWSASLCPRPRVQRPSR